MFLRDSYVHIRPLPSKSTLCDCYKRARMGSWTADENGTLLPDGRMSRQRHAVSQHGLARPALISKVLRQISRQSAPRTKFGLA